MGGGPARTCRASPPDERRRPAWPAAPDRRPGPASARRGCRAEGRPRGREPWPGRSRGPRVAHGTTAPRRRHRVRRVPPTRRPPSRRRGPRRSGATPRTSADGRRGARAHRNRTALARARRRGVGSPGSSVRSRASAHRTAGTREPRSSRARPGSERRTATDPRRTRRIAWGTAPPAAGRAPPGR